MKKIFSVILILSIVITFTLGLSIQANACSSDVTHEDVLLFIERIKEVYGNGYGEETMELNNIKDAAVLCGLSSASDEYGAIFIGKLLDRPGYIVTMGGTEPFNSDENVGIKEDILSSFNQSNEYKENTINAILSTVPSGEDIYIYGYSLGGMVMQQVLTDKSIQKNYNICTAVAFGSPVTALLRQRIVFIEDVSDVVPNLSVGSMLLPRLVRRYDTHIVRDGNYKTFIGAHALSYVDSNIWDDIDALGHIGENETLIIDMKNVVTFKG